MAQHTALEQCGITVILSRGLFPKSRKGKEKRRYSLLVFWMESFRSASRLSYWDNGSRPPCCALPAPLPPHSSSLYLPVSRNTRHILLSTTRQPRVHFLLLSSSLFTPALFPGRALTAPCTLKQQWQIQTDKQTLPFSIETQPLLSTPVIPINAVKQVSRRAHSTQMSKLYLAIPCSTDFKRQWKLLVLFQWCW